MTPPTPDTPWTLSRLLAPMDEAEFLAEYFDRKPVHIPGDPDKFREVMSWDKLNAILNMTAVWGSQSLKLVQDRQTIPPARYCRQATGREGGLSVPGRDLPHPPSLEKPVVWGRARDRFARSDVLDAFPKHAAQEIDQMPGTFCRHKAIAA